MRTSLLFESVAVAFYRLYFMGSGTKIDRFHQFEAPDDEAAIRRAEMLHGARAMELWDGPRFVERWDPLTVDPG